MAPRVPSVTPTPAALYAFLRLHFAQQEESVFVLADLPDASSRWGWPSVMVPISGAFGEPVAT